MKQRKRVVELKKKIMLINTKSNQEIRAGELCERTGRDSDNIVCRYIWRRHNKQKIQKTRNLKSIIDSRSSSYCAMHISTHLWYIRNQNIWNLQFNDRTTKLDRFYSARIPFPGFPFPGHWKTTIGHTLQIPNKYSSIFNFSYTGCSKSPGTGDISTGKHLEKNISYKNLTLKVISKGKWTFLDYKFYA